MTDYMTFFSYSLALLLVLAAWQYVFVPTLKCHYQDAIFRLHLEVIRFFQKDCHGGEKCNIACSYLIGLLNGYANNISMVSFLYLAMIRIAYLKNPELAKHIEQRTEMMENRLKGENEEQRRYIAHIRAEAYKSLFRFMLFRNPILFVLIAAFAVRHDIGRILNFKRMEQFVCIRTN